MFHQGIASGIYVVWRTVGAKTAFLSQLIFCSQCSISWILFSAEQWLFSWWLLPPCRCFAAGCLWRHNQFLTPNLSLIYWLACQLIQSALNIVWQIYLHRFSKHVIFRMFLLIVRAHWSTSSLHCQMLLLISTNNGLLMMWYLATSVMPSTHPMNGEPCRHPRELCWIDAFWWVQFAMQAHLYAVEPEHLSKKSASSL